MLTEDIQFKLEINQVKNLKLSQYLINFQKMLLKPKKKIILGFDPKLHTEKQLNILFKIKNVNLKPN